MNFLGNLLWILLGGLFVSLYYAIVGLAFCLTIVGIPFGVQLFKIAGFALCPFGRQVVPGTNDGGCLSILMNIIWIIFGGIEIALAHVVLGITFCITIIGIPFGVQNFKMALLALTPFGKEIV
ncbi:MAG: YccF domain-containing protein [Bacteroidales bacterium]|nr:YccF domain-containing protein [Bacteroidales bacterium]